MSESKRFLYKCAKCGSSVHKPKVEMDEKKFVHGLHGWTCPTCGPTKVKRTLRSKESE